MLELLQDVLPWLAAFYVADGVFVVRRGHLLLAGGWPGWARPLGPGLHFAALAPWSEIVRVLDVLVVPGTESLHRRGGGPHWNPTVLGPDDLDAEPWPAPEAFAVRGASVTIVGRDPISTASAEIATELARFLMRIAGAPQASRADVIRELVERSGPRGFGERLATLLWARRAVAAAGSLAFVGWFIVLPVVAFGGPIGAALLLEAGVIVGVAHAAVVASGLWLVRSAGAGWARAVIALCPVALFPPLGARALAHIGIDLHAEFDGSALAIALVPNDSLVTFARQRLVRARRTRDAFRGFDSSVWAAAREEILREAVAARAVRPALLAGPPLVRYSDAAAYCPTCDTQFRAGISACPDCLVPTSLIAQGPAAGRAATIRRG